MAGGLSSRPPGPALVINPFASLRLTAAERRVAQDRIAAWATAAALTILPPMGARGRINAHVECAAESTLQLEIKVPGHGTKLYAAPFDTGKPWQAELERRLRQVIANGHGHHDHNPAAATGVPRKEGASDWFFDERACITKKLMTIVTPCPGPRPEPGVVHIMLTIQKRNGQGEPPAIALLRVLAELHQDHARFTLTKPWAKSIIKRCARSRSPYTMRRHNSHVSW